MSHTQPETHSLRWRLVWILLSITVLLASTSWLFSVDASESEISDTQMPIALPLVSVTEAKAQAAAIEVNALSQAQPKWVVDIKSTVNGKAIEVSSKALAGSYVSKGDLLVVLEDTPYKAEVAQISLQLAQAKHQLALAQGNTKVAKRQYKKRRNSEANELALQLPQLRVAKQAVASAKARLLVAKQQLENTRITAPFSGYITQRLINLGQYVTSSDTLLRLEDSDTLTLKVELSQGQWQHLKQPINGSTATVFDSANNFLTSAHVLQGGGYLDPKTRQRAVYLEVANARDKSLLAGQFVKVSFHGISFAKTLTLPASALTQNGYIWHINKQDRLERFTPRVLMRKQQQLIIHEPLLSPVTTIEKWRIAITPLAAFLPGQQVQVRMQ